MAHREVLVRARAIETQCYILAANQGGQHSVDRHTFGCSMIVDPWGEVLAKAGAATLTSKRQSGAQEKIRQQMPVIQHRQSFTIKNL